MRFRTRKHFAVLIRLAVEAGRPLTRDSLIDLLWSDAADHLARHSLAQAITVLKSKLGHEQLVARKGTIALAPHCVDVDIAHLDACDAEIRGPFLDGLEMRDGARAFDDWKAGWQARLIPKVRDCLVKQMDAGRRIGDFTTVEQRAQVLLDLDPVSEDAVRGLMEARAWVGDRSNALQVFARYETRLAEDLDARPSPELVRVANLLREGRRALRRRTTAGPPEPGDPPLSHEKRFESETLVGREREFSALYDGWLAARGRAPRLMVVTGDPGVGKTTLCNAFASTCQMEGAVVARAQAYDAERELPFAVLSELVRQLTIQRAIGAADPEALSELSRISTEVAAVFPGVPKPVEWSAEVTPLRLADAFLKVITAAAEENPVLLVVDDVHAVDNASAAILHLVARKLSAVRLVLILTGRTSELRASAAPAALVTDGTIAGLRTVEVEPLTPEAASQLVARLSSALSPASSASILQASNGNPLAIELLIRECLTQGASSLLRDLERLNTMPAATLGIPRAIRAVFERQSQRLAPPTRAAMDLAAVLGRRLTDLALYEAVELKPGEAGEALSRLLEEGLLRDVHGDLEFRNELIRAQAYYGVAGPPRQHLHRRVAELLAARAPEEGESLKLEIAWHYLRGGAPAKALPFALAGAEEALEVGAPREAEEILKPIIPHLTQTGSADLLRTQLLLVKGFLDQSKATDALPLLHSLEEANDITDHTSAEIARLLALAEHILNSETGHRQFNAAAKALLRAKRTSDSHLVAEALLEYARSGVESGDEPRVREAYRLVTQMLESQAGKRLHIAHYTQGFCLYHLYQPEQARDALKTAIAVLGATGSVVQLSIAYTGLGNSLRGICDLEGSRHAFETALGLAKRIGNDSRASIIAGNIVALLLLQGDYQQAIQVGIESLELGGRCLSQPFLGGAYLNLAEAYALSGEIGKAKTYREAALRWMQQERSWRSRVEVLSESAGLELILGNASSAIDLIRRAEKLAEGKERAIPPQSSLEMLRAFRIANEVGEDQAMIHVEGLMNRFHGRLPIEYLNALGVRAWLEKRLYGEYSRETDEGLELFDTLGIPGQKRLLTALGFLPAR